MLPFLVSFDRSPERDRSARPSLRSTSVRAVAGRRAASGQPHRHQLAAQRRHQLAASRRRRSVAGSPVATPRLHLLTCTAHRSPLHAIAALDI